MLELKDGFVLYHGSYCEVKEPNLAKCAKRKDFGQGFYLTTSKELAESFLRTSIAKAIATGTIEEGQKFGYISTFEFKWNPGAKYKYPQQFIEAYPNSSFKVINRSNIEEFLLDL